MRRNAVTALGEHDRKETARLGMAQKSDADLAD